MKAQEESAKEKGSGEKGQIAEMTVLKASKHLLDLLGDLNNQNHTLF